MSPSVPPQLGTTRDSGVDFVLLDLTNSIEEGHARRKDTTPVLPLPSATKPDYVVRRIECWNKGYVSEELLDVSTSLPSGPQAVFRRKLLLVLALQLFVVWIAVGLGTFYPPVRDRVIPVFIEHNPVLLGAAALLTLVLLGVLYYQRRRRYVNMLILMWFSAAQAATFVGLGVTFDTHVGFFNCGATFTWVLLMVVLVGVRLKERPGEGCPLSNSYLMSPLVAGALSFAVVICASCALFMIFGTRFVTNSAFGYSLVFQFILLGWFAWDATCMFEVVAVDEYAYGVIYIYTDIVLSFLFSVAAAGVAVGFTSLMVLMFASGGDGPDPSCCCEFSFSCCVVCEDVDFCDGRTRSRSRSRRTGGVNARRDQRMERV
ncbi:Protein kinase [Phytophthora cinnamomi]|uniref:Protein kinase n=1 Tax=Phytophthora cinnamomi TaxID=4785 RepID=UPI00355A2164|nr:Protein kinase [Phytophthora cinnamomi]